MCTPGYRHTLLCPIPNHTHHPHYAYCSTLLCVLFVFFNRAQRVIRNGSTLTHSLDLSCIALLLASALIHTVMMCPGLVVPTRGGRIPVVFALLLMLLLHSVAILLITTTLNRYITTSGFLSVLVASHLCFAIRPIQPDVVQSQKISYEYVTKKASYVLAILC